jgi:hypothetical protein
MGLGRVTLDWVELGTLGEWAAALFTGAAFFIALRVVREESTARARQAARERMEQARLCNAWCYDHPDPAKRARGTILLEVANNSEQPVFSVRARPAGWPHENWLIDVPVIAPRGGRVEAFTPGIQIHLRQSWSSPTTQVKSGSAPRPGSCCSPSRCCLRRPLGGISSGSEPADSDRRSCEGRGGICHRGADRVRPLRPAAGL